VTAVGLATPGPSPVGGRWQLVGGPAAFDCGRVHRAAGTLDETSRRLSHEEWGAASALAGEGHHVAALRPVRGGRRTPDLVVCGEGVEIKSWLPAVEREGRRPGPLSVYNKLVSACGQARHAVLVAGDSGLEPAAARRGMADFARDHPGRLDSVRVMGDGWDLSWRRAPALEAGITARPARGRPLEL
jgi:hypothetical protein